jgi:hypothetical protein
MLYGFPIGFTALMISLRFPCIFAFCYWILSFIASGFTIFFTFAIIEDSKNGLGLGIKLHKVVPAIVTTHVLVFGYGRQYFQLLDDIFAIIQFKSFLVIFLLFIIGIIFCITFAAYFVYEKTLKRK